MIDYSGLKSYLFPIICGLLTTLRFTSSCNVANIDSCSFSNLIKTDHTFDIAFIPKDTLDSTCRQLQTALECALKDDFMKGCGSSRKRPFEAQSTIQKAICKDYYYAYKISTSCFSQDDVQQEVKNCLEKLHVSDGNFCQVVETVRLCTREMIRKTATCKQTDASLMGKLVDLYLEHYTSDFNCEMKNIEEDPILTKPPVGATTMKAYNMTTESGMSITPTMTGGSTMGPKTTTTEGGAKRQSSSILLTVFQISFTAFTLFNFVNFL